MFEIITSIILITFLFFGIPIGIMYGTSFIFDLMKNRKSKIKTEFEKDENLLKISGMDPLLKLTFLFFLVFATLTYRPGEGSGLHGPEEITIILIILWLLFFFGIHKITLFKNNTLITHRLVKKTNIPIDEIISIKQTLRWYKVTHKKGVFRFSDLLTGSTGMVNSFVHINPKIKYEKFDFKDLKWDPMGLGFFVNFIEVGIILCLIIGLVVWHYIKN